MTQEAEILQALEALETASAGRDIVLVTKNAHGCVVASKMDSAPAIILLGQGIAGISQREVILCLIEKTNSAEKDCTVVVINGHGQHRQSLQIAGKALQKSAEEM